MLASAPVVRRSLFLVLLAAFGCARIGDAPSNEGSSSDESTQTGATSTSESNGSGSEDGTETETGADEPMDGCAASPEIADFQASFDGWRSDIDYPDVADWNEPCTVTAHTGALASGETITLACVTAEGLAVEHVIEIQAALDDDAEQPTMVSLAVGEPVQLTLWSRVWFAGGATWMLRAMDGGANGQQLDDIRLLYYSSIEVFDPADTDFSPTPAFAEPLEVSVRDGDCELFCPEPHPGGFVDFGDCDCEIEQLIEFVHGPDTALIQNGSAAPLGASMFGFVDTAKLYPIDDGCTDQSGAWYTFLVVAH
jgi:hypothetical protein